MAQVKGKFIKLTARFMYPNELEIADEYLKNFLGKTHRDLKDEEWYSAAIFDKFLRICVENSLSHERLYVVVGKKVYPTIKQTTRLPSYLKTPLDFIKYEAEGFLENNRGDDVVPRKIIIAEEGHVMMEAIAPCYSNKLYEGVWLGILEMCGITTGKVENLWGDVFLITW